MHAGNSQAIAGLCLSVPTFNLHFNFPSRWTPARVISFEYKLKFLFASDRDVAEYQRWA